MDDLRKAICFMVLLCLCAGQAIADVFKQVDRETGRVFYTDCPKGADYELVVQTGAREEVVKLAEQGNAEAQYKLGCSATKDYTQAAAWFRRAAEQGFAPAQNDLGWMYVKGLGVAQDYKKAFSWFTKAAIQGHASAQGALGWMYDSGQGVVQDYKQAASWYRKAAEQGVGEAQASLGVRYAEGQGVPQDYIEAHKWFNLAGSTGNATAIKNRDAIARRMTAAQIAEAQKSASEWQAEFEKRH